nr:mitochondrial transcription rescue factor 1-like [Procambarus clarkii]
MAWACHNIGLNCIYKRTIRTIPRGISILHAPNSIAYLQNLPRNVSYRSEDKTLLSGLSTCGRNGSVVGSLHHRCGVPGCPLLPSTSLLAATLPCLHTVTRSKSKGSSYNRNKTMKGKGEEEFSDEDVDDDEMILESGSDFRDIKAKIPSLRMDAILKAGLGMSRNKMEGTFYSSKIRVNGEKILKKSKQLLEGDEIDVIKGPCDQNPDLLNISRVVILKVGNFDEDSDKVMVKLRKYPQLLIEKYSDYKCEDNLS